MTAFRRNVLPCLLVACGFAYPLEAASRSVSETIERWLECDECDHDELAEVIELGRAAVVRLETALDEGPSDVRVETERTRLHKTFDLMERYAAAHPDEPAVAAPRAAFVAAYVMKFEERYRSQAITALGSLGALGDVDAKRALTEALLRTDLSTALREGLRRALERRK